MMFFRLYRKELVLVFVSAVLASLPFHSPRFAPLAWIALVPLFACLDRLKNRNEAFRFGYIWGVFFFGMTLYWVWYVAVIGYITLALYLGVFGGLFGFFAYRSVTVLANSGSPHFRHGWINVFTLAALWVLVEYARLRAPVLGFPWVLWGYTQWRNIPFIQTADHWGAWGVSFTLVAANAALYGIFAAVRRVFKYELSLGGVVAQVALMSVLGGGLAAASVVYGNEALKTFGTDSTVPPRKIAVVQGNIPQHEKWDAGIKDMIFQKYDGLSRQTALERPELVIWPETAFPGYWEDEPPMQARFQALARSVNARFLIGSPTLVYEDGVEKHMNTALYFGPRGERLGAYHKLRLVPFGEYVPFFGFLRRFFEIGRFSPGRRMVLFSLPAAQPDQKNVLLAVLICFEDIFPDLCRNLTARGCRLLVNITNDAWFLKSSAPYQHAQASVFRAVENRVNVVRVANTGLSSWIDPAGRVRDTVQDKGEELFVTGIRVWNVPIDADSPRTFYGVWGDFFVVLAAVYFALTYPLYRLPHNLVRAAEVSDEDE